jgi:hypothetical protein
VVGSSAVASNIIQDNKVNASFPPLEGDLLAAEVAESTTVGGAATATAATAAITAEATASTETASSAASAAVTESSSATTSATATTAEATATATTTSAAVAAIVAALRSEVEADVAAGNVGTLQSLMCGLSLLNGAHLDVTETLEGTSVTVGRETDGLDGTVLAEGLGQGILIGIEANVADEDGVGWGLGGVAVLVGTVEALLLRSLLRAGLASVHTKLTVVKQVAVTSGESLLCIGSAGVLDVSEPLAAARLAVGDDAYTLDLTELLELASQPLLVDVPAKVANEKVCGCTGLLISLALFRGVLGGSLSLTLLALGDGGLLFLVFLVIIAAVVFVVIILWKCQHGVWVSSLDALCEPHHRHRQLPLA